MSWNINYDLSYVFNKKIKVENKRDMACFSRIFSLVDGSPVSDLKINVFVFTRKEGASYREGNQMSFTIDEANEFFGKCSKLFDPPIIREVTKEELQSLDGYRKLGDVLCFQYDFSGKTPIYIKSALTLSRYMYESGDNFGVVARLALDFSNKLPQIPFIEIFAVCHNAENTNTNGHSLFSVSSMVKDPSIYTEECIYNKLQKSGSFGINQTFGFYYPSNYVCERNSQRQVITEEVIINFKRISC